MDVLWSIYIIFTCLHVGITHWSVKFLLWTPKFFKRLLLNSLGSFMCSMVSLIQSFLKNLKCFWSADCINRYVAHCTMVKRLHLVASLANPFPNPPLAGWSGHLQWCSCCFLVPTNPTPFVGCKQHYSTCFCYTKANRLHPHNHYQIQSICMWLIWVITCDVRCCYFSIDMEGLKSSSLCVFIRIAEIYLKIHCNTTDSTWTW